MTALDPDVLAAALAGDPDAADDVLADDVVLIDRTAGDRTRGRGAVGEHWGEFAGRRAAATIDEIVTDGARAAIRYTVTFGADAARFVQRGTAWVDLDVDGRVASWDCLWAESAAP